MTEHEEQADRLEAEADKLEQQSKAVGDDIEDAKDVREQARHDETVPGMPAGEGGLPPEANPTTSGDKPPDDDQ
jgi:hypothetical protein